MLNRIKNWLIVSIRAKSGQILQTGLEVFSAIDFFHCGMVWYMSVHPYHISIIMSSTNESRKKKKMIITIRMHPFTLEGGEIPEEKSRLENLKMLMDDSSCNEKQY